MEKCQRIEELTKYTIKVFIDGFDVKYQITNKQNGTIYFINEPNSAFSIDSELDHLKLLLGD